MPIPLTVLVVALRSVAEVGAFSPNTRFLSLFWGFLLLLTDFRDCDYLPWLRLWGGLFAPYAYPTLRPSPAVAGLVGFRCGPHHWLSLFVGFAVSLVRRLVFHLVPCSSSGACGLHCLPCRRLPLGVSAFSDTVCLTYCCAGGVGWAATLPLGYQCFSCNGRLAGVHWVLYPVSGSSHRGCDCPLDDSVVALFDSTCL